MDDYLREALDIVKAQASVRNMTEDEIASMLTKLSCAIKGVCVGEIEPDREVDPQAAQRSIKEKSITCLECGKGFKIITKRHLALHDLDAASYCEKWGFKKNTPLVCKSLQRERRRKMKDMQLWEKRRKKKAD